MRLSEYMKQRRHIHFLKINMLWLHKKSQFLKISMWAHITLMPYCGVSGSSYHDSETNYLWIKKLAKHQKHYFTVCGRYTNSHSLIKMTKPTWSGHQQSACLRLSSTLSKCGKAHKVDLFCKTFHIGEHAASRDMHGP